MKIALVSTPSVSVPPRMYGGTELFVFNLASELVRRGHEVYLFATGDSHVEGVALGYFYQKAQWPPCKTHDERHLHSAVQWLKDLASDGIEIDVVHWNTPFAVRYAGEISIPSLLTWHNHLDENLSTLYLDHQEVQYVAISGRQKAMEVELPLITVIHHGLDPSGYISDSVRTDRTDRPSAVFLGRMAPEKGPDIAIRAARKAGYHLSLAGPVHEKDVDFYDRSVRPLLGPDVSVIGEVGGQKKTDLLSQGDAFLFPIGWEEPFGLVMIEAMFCGTPVVAFRKGSAPEVVEEGVTGFLVETEEEMVDVLKNKIPSIDREGIRKRAIERFSSGEMCRKYLSLYRKMADGNKGIKSLKTFVDSIAD